MVYYKWDVKNHTLQGGFDLIVEETKIYFTNFQTIGISNMKKNPDTCATIEDMH